MTTLFMAPAVSIHRTPRSQPVPAAGWTALGHFMRQRHRTLGLSISAVCARVNITRETWYRLARGENESPTVGLLRRLAAVYRVPAERLFSLATAQNERHRPPAPSAGRPPAALPQPRVLMQHPPTAVAGHALDVEFELRNDSGSPMPSCLLRPVAEHLLELPQAGLPDDVPGFGAAPGLLHGPVMLPALAPYEMAWMSVRLQMPDAAGLYIAQWSIAATEAAATARMRGPGHANDNGAQAPNPPSDARSEPLTSLHVLVLPR